MQIINRKNFFPVVCVSFTLIVSGKLILEKMMGHTDAYYTENIFTCLGISFLAVLVLSLQYYLRNFPLLPVIIGQYVLVIAVVFCGIWIMSQFSEMSESSYRDMFISVSIPYFVGAFAYYSAFFSQIRNANKLLDEMNRKQN